MNYSKRFNEEQSPSKLSNEVIDFIISHEFPDYDNIDWDNTYVHNTYWSNLEDIINQGLLVKKNTSNCFTWGVDLPKAKEVYRKNRLKDTWDGAGGCSIIFRPKRDIHKERMNDCEYGFYDDILPEDILAIDLPFVNEGKGLRASDIVEDMKEYGVDEVLNVYDSSFRFSFLTEKQYDMLMNWCMTNYKNGERLLEAEWSTKYHYSNNTYWNYQTLSDALNNRYEIERILQDLIELDLDSEYQIIIRRIYGSTRKYEEEKDRFNIRYLVNLKRYLYEFVHTLETCRNKKHPESFNIYRAIRIPEGKTLDFDDLGVCWTFDKKILSYVESWLVEDSESHNDNYVRLAGFTNETNIDWIESFYLYIYYFKEECELRLLNPKLVKLSSYAIVTLVKKQYSDEYEVDKVLMQKGNVDLLNL